MQLVRLLVERGADVHFRNKGGKTPCDVAAPGLIPHILTSTNSVGKYLKMILHTKLRKFKVFLKVMVSNRRNRKRSK